MFCVRYLSGIHYVFLSRSLDGDSYIFKERRVMKIRINDSRMTFGCDYLSDVWCTVVKPLAGFILASPRSSYCCRFSFLPEGVLYYLYSFSYTKLDRLVFDEDVFCFRLHLYSCLSLE